MSENSFTVVSESKLLELLLKQYASKSRSKIKKVLTAGSVRVNGKVVTRHDHLLKPGDEIEISWKPEAAPKKFKMLSIVFEDETILVINKMSGLLSISAGQEGEPTAYRQLRDYVEATQPERGLYVVHRLDRDTSGLMMFAKSEEVRSKLQRNWKRVITSRRYVALVEGVPSELAGTISSFLRESKAMKMHSTNNPDEGDKAITHYKTLISANGYSLVECELETGKKNQIRVHMADLKTPVAGDTKYGASTNPVGRLALHAAGISFNHPLTHEPMSFELPVPNKFLEVLKQN